MSDSTDPAQTARDRIAAALGGAAPPQRPVVPPSAAAPRRDRPGGGIEDEEELVRLIRLLRAAEPPAEAPRDVQVGEFTVDGRRIPLSRVEALRGLTRTEAAVLRFLGWGRANADIATLLNINETTVRTHMTNAIKKLDVDGTRGLNGLAGLLFHPLD